MAPLVVVNPLEAFSGFNGKRRTIESVEKFPDRLHHIGEMEAVREAHDLPAMTDVASLHFGDELDW